MLSGKLFHLRPACEIPMTPRVEVESKSAQWLGSMPCGNLPETTGEQSSPVFHTGIFKCWETPCGVKTSLCTSKESEIQDSALL